MNVISEKAQFKAALERQDLNDNDNSFVQDGATAHTFTMSG